jgi:hypothetical protein
LVLAGFIKVFGVGIFQVRLLAILINLVIMATVYLLMRRILSRQPALLFVLLIGLSDAFFSYSFYARPTQLSVAFFMSCLLLAAIAQQLPRGGYAVSSISGLLMGCAILSHASIITYGLILPLTFIFLSPPSKKWRSVVPHIFSATVGLCLPICIYLVWLGSDFPEWWHVQEILAGSDATNNRDLSISFGLWEFLRINFFHWNFDFDYQPYKLLAVHRQRVWLGFPWGWAFAVGGIYCMVLSIFKHTEGEQNARYPYRWITVSVLVAVIMPGIFFPWGGTEYLLPVQVIFTLALAVFLSDVISCDWSVRFKRLFWLFGISVIVMILSLRLYYNINVFITVMNERGYEHYMAQLRESLPDHSFSSVVGPHLIAAGFIGYKFFDFYSLYDFYASKDRDRLRKGWKTEHPPKTEFPIAFCERLLRNRDLLVTNAKAVKRRTMLVMDAFAESGFYEEVARVESKYYGVSRAYLSVEERCRPIASEVTSEGDLLIKLLEKEPLHLYAVFIRYQRPRSSIPEMWLSVDGRVYHEVEAKEQEVLGGRDGLLWTAKGLPMFSRIRISGVDEPKFVAVCASSDPEQGRKLSVLLTDSNQGNAERETLSK